MKTTGLHLLAEYIDCDASILNDSAVIERLLNGAAAAAKTKVVASLLKPFYPQGVSGVVVIEESHLSIHTWPEKGYAAVDFFTCGDGDPLKAHDIIYAGLKAKRCEYLLLSRGNVKDACVIQYMKHVRLP